MNHAQRERTRLIIARIVVGLGVALFWYATSVPWGVSMLEFAPFAAPGALLGLGASWMSRILTRSGWTWRRALDAALFGAAILPPMLTMVIAVGGARPERVLAGIVRASWISLVGGAAWGGLMWIRDRSEKVLEMHRDPVDKPAKH